MTSDRIEILTLELGRASDVLSDIARLLYEIDDRTETDNAALLRVMRAAADGAAKSSAVALGLEPWGGGAAS